MNNIRFLQLHEELFHAGKNFGKKLIPKAMIGLQLQLIDSPLNQKEKCISVTWAGRTGYLFNTSCHFMELEDSVEVTPIGNQHVTEDISKRHEAQVSTPHGYVFEGPGKGKTGTGKR